MTHRGPFQPLPFCDSVIPLPSTWQGWLPTLASGVPATLSSVALAKWEAPVQPSSETPPAQMGPSAPTDPLDHPPQPQAGPLPLQRYCPAHPTSSWRVARWMVPLNRSHTHISLHHLLLPTGWEGRAASRSSSRQHHLLALHSQLRDHPCSHRKPHSAAFTSTFPHPRLPSNTTDPQEHPPGPT